MYASLSSQQLSREGVERNTPWSDDEAENKWMERGEVGSQFHDRGYFRQDKGHMSRDQVDYYLRSIYPGLRSLFFFLSLRLRGPLIRSQPSQLSFLAFLASKTSLRSLTRFLLPCVQLAPVKTLYCQRVVVQNHEWLRWILQVSVQILVDLQLPVLGMGE